MLVPSVATVMPLDDSVAGRLPQRCLLFDKSLGTATTEHAHVQYGPKTATRPKPAAQRNRTQLTDAGNHATWLPLTCCLCMVLIYAGATSGYSQVLQ